MVTSIPTLHKPATYLPDHVITLEETLALITREHANARALDQALSMIANTGVQARHLIDPIDRVTAPRGFGERNRTFEAEAKRVTPALVDEALDHAGLDRPDIDAVIFVSCTGFMMPSMTAWLINRLRLDPTTVQIPISQLGCAAGAAGINRAADHVRAHPGANAVVVSCELCSLCYQPADDSVGSLLSKGLFGDAMSAAIVSSGPTATDADGLQIHKVGSYLIPDTERWISYDVLDSGFHFRLDKRVPSMMAPIAPRIAQFAADYAWDVDDLDFYIIHAGGPRILDELGTSLEIPLDEFHHSRETLTQCGNIASSVVLEATARSWDAGVISPGARGLLAGFGPGITTESSLLTAVGEFPTTQTLPTASTPMRGSHGDRELVAAHTPAKPR
ncbi:type III polyketide synthase [Tsukamurella sp. 8F]|uniref:type III polyketide synthase n=1 Tax=unclassified Tsukamurella TaxID=2633480 RepID=UPI0023B9E35D|nr:MULTISPECIES: type III polyketide synthase [unclassified Tsukamurella]MDF0531102.1 type III polyketide synthase [Tsukamurella sp. 8J]MDF0588348.1 type III polyketide synthase [Tsukamurella sp. 8F]